MITEDETYGAMPFEKVKKIKVKVKDLESAEEATYLQYKLMLLKTVLRVYVDFSNHEVTVIYDPHTPGGKPEILNTVRPAMVEILSEVEEDYRDVVARSYNV